MDAIEGLDNLGQGVIAFEDAAAKPLARDFDFLGQLDFFLTGQQGDRAHLGQVHADRVVDALAVPVFFQDREIDFA